MPGSRLRLSTDGKWVRTRHGEAMIGNSLHSLTFVGLAASAAVLMALSGLQKKVLRRKQTSPRCPTCGRTDRYSCACRR
jgi:uncharacterized iron-regulated membrane protein